MTRSDHHSESPDVSFDGGSLDCGSGLLLLIRKHIDPMEKGQSLEIVSTESSVEEDLPAWCRLTGNELVSWTRQGDRRSFLVCKGACGQRAARSASTPAAATQKSHITPVRIPDRLPDPSPTAEIPPLAVMGVGSWPAAVLDASGDSRPHGRALSEEEFRQAAEDAMRLAVAAQVRAGVDIVTDGEQTRDSYASFVGARLDNCQLVPLTDLLALVDDPEEFAQELRALDVPAQDVRHPSFSVPWAAAARWRSMN